MDADAAPTASGPISKGDPRLRADPDRAWTPIEPGHGGEATRAQAGWLEQAEEGVGRGALLLASATFLRKLLNHHRNREKVKFYDQMLTSCVKNMSVRAVRRCGSSSFARIHVHARALEDGNARTLFFEVATQEAGYIFLTYI